MPSKSVSVKNEKQYEDSRKRACQISGPPGLPIVQMLPSMGGRAPERLPTQNRAGRPPKRRKRAARAAKQLLRSHEVAAVHFLLRKGWTWTKGMIWMVGLRPVALIGASGTTATPEVRPTAVGLDMGISAPRFLWLR